MLAREVNVVVHLGPTATKVRPIYAFPNLFIFFVVSPRIPFYFPPFDLATFVSRAHILRDPALHLRRIGAVYHDPIFLPATLAIRFKTTSSSCLELPSSRLSSVITPDKMPLSLIHPEGPLPSVYKKSSAPFRA